MADFNEIEFLTFLKDEFLAKGGKPEFLDSPVTSHAEVKRKFSLSEIDYRALVARFEANGIVGAIGLDASNGYLEIRPLVVEVARKAEEFMQADKMFDNLLRTNGEDFIIQTSNGDNRDARGLRNGDGNKGAGRKYIGFKHDTAISEGDVIKSKISGEEFHVVEIAKTVFMNQLMQVKAYYELASERRMQSTSTVNIGHVHNSAIMMNSPNASQTLTFTQANRNDATTVLAAVRAALDKLELDDSARDDLKSNIDFAESQLRRESPKIGMLKGALQGIYEGLSEVSNKAVNAVTTALAIELANQVLGLLGVIQ